MMAMDHHDTRERSVSGGLYKLRIEMKFEKRLSAISTLIQFQKEKDRSREGSSSHSAEYFSNCYSILSLLI